MNDNKYAEYGILELESIILELQAQSPINTSELIEARNALAEKQAAQVKQERITTAISEAAVVVDNLEIAPGMLLRDMCIDEQSYQFVKIAFQTLLNKKDTKYIDEIAAASERETNLNFQIKQRDNQIEALEGQLRIAVDANTEWQKQVNQIMFERDEALKVRDNASNELEGCKLMLDEKQKQIDTLRSEIAVGAKGAVQIDQTEQLRMAQEAWKASRIKVSEMYEDKEDFRGATWKVRLLGDYEGIGNDGELITISYLEKGKYLKQSQEEVERFRQEQQAQALAASQEVTVESVPLVTEIANVEQFREEANTVRQLEGLDTSAVGEVAQASIEERVAKVEQEQVVTNQWVVNILEALHTHGIEVVEAETSLIGSKGVA